MGALLPGFFARESSAGIAGAIGSLTVVTTYRQSFGAALTLAVMGHHLQVVTRKLLKAAEESVVSRHQSGPPGKTRADRADSLFPGQAEARQPEQVRLQGIRPAASLNKRNASKKSLAFIGISLSGNSAGSACHWHAIQGMRNTA